MRAVVPASVRSTAGLLALLIAAAGCGESPETSRDGASGSTHGGTLVLGSISDVDNWNPYLTRQGFTDTLLRRIWLPLAAPAGRDRDGLPSFEPQLAESWSFSDDGRTLTFTLRPAVWSDGVPLTADDVVFTWQAQTSAEVAWGGSASKSRIEDVRAVDERTVAFHFARSYPEQLADACEGVILPRHVFGQVAFADWLTHDWSTLRVGSGPFVPEEHRPAERIVLAANPRYFREGLPRVARVVVRVVPDAGNLLMQLRAGDVDYVRGLAPREAARVESDPDGALAVYDRAGFDFIGWNEARPPFDDPEVRRALTLAIDRRALVDELLYGFGKVSYGPLPSSSWAASESIEPWPHDPREALRILAARGFTAREGDGALIRDGRPFRFRLVTNAGNTVREGAAVKIQEQLRRIGVQVDVQPLEMRALIADLRAGDFDAYLLGVVYSGKVDLRGMFGSAAVPPAGSNVIGYRSERVDRLLDEVDEAKTWQRMKDALDAVQLEIHRDVPLTFLYEEQRIDAHREALTGVRIDVPSDPLRNLENYSIER